MKRSRCILLAVCVALGALGAAALAEDDATFGRATLIDDALQRESIQLIGLTEGRVSYFDADRTLTQRDVDQIVALRLDSKAGLPQPEVHVQHAPPPMPALPPGITMEGDMVVIDGNIRLRLDGIRAANVVINKRRIDFEALRKIVAERKRLTAAHAGADEPDQRADAPAQIRLTDGQRLTGSLAGAVDEQTLMWDAAHGTVAVPIDRIVSIHLRGPTPDTDARDDADVIGMTNDDEIAGLLESISETDITMNVDGQTLSVAWDQVAHLRLINPAEAAAGTWVWLDDGSRLLTTGLVITRERVTAQCVDGQALNVPRAAVRGARFTHDHDLVDLQSLTPTIEAGGVVFGVPTPPEHGDEQVILHAPIRVRYALPAGAVRFAAVATVDQEDLEWADLELMLSAAGSEAERVRLNAQRPGAVLNLPLQESDPPTTMVIELDPGVNGPVRDRVTLSDAFILVERP